MEETRNYYAQIEVNVNGSNPEVNVRSSIFKEELQTEDETFVDYNKVPELQISNSQIKIKKEPIESECDGTQPVSWEPSQVWVKEEPIEEECQDWQSESCGTSLGGGSKLTGEIDNKLEENVSKKTGNESDSFNIGYNIWSAQYPMLGDRNSGEDCRPSEPRTPNPSGHIYPKLFKCNDCSRAFSRKPNLYRHFLSVHEKLREFPCTFCDYACSDRGNLAKHIRAVHEKLKPFKCPHCEYSCSKRGNLASHNKYIHLKRKPVECKVEIKEENDPVAEIKEETDPATVDVGLFMKGENL